MSFPLFLEIYCKFKKCSLQCGSCAADENHFIAVFFFSPISTPSHHDTGVNSCNWIFLFLFCNRQLFQPITREVPHGWNIWTSTLVNNSLLSRVDWTSTKDLGLVLFSVLIGWVFLCVFFSSLPFLLHPYIDNLSLRLL